MPKTLCFLNALKRTPTWLDLIYVVGFCTLSGNRWIYTYQKHPDCADQNPSMVPKSAEPGSSLGKKSTQDMSGREREETWSICIGYGVTTTYLRKWLKVDHERHLKTRNCYSPNIWFLPYHRRFRYPASQCWQCEWKRSFCAGWSLSSFTRL